MFRRIVHTFILGIVFSQGTFAQSKRIQATFLSNKNAIVYDLSIDRTNGTFAATSGNQIDIWNYRDLTLIKSWTTSRIIALDYWQGKVAGASADGSIHFWGSGSDDELSSFKLSDSPITCIRWVDSTRIVAGTDSGDIIQYYPATGKMVTMANSGKVITCLAIQPDRQIIISGNASGQLSRWNSATGELITEQNAHSGWIRNISFGGPNGETVFTVGDDGTLKEWQTNSNLRLQLIEKTRIGNWLLCVDAEMNDKTQTFIVAVGKRSGEVVVKFPFGKYRISTGSMVNNVALLGEYLPKIRLLVATHGSGVQMISATKMKLE